jgi:hypothetical protein
MKEFLTYLSAHITNQLIDFRPLFILTHLQNRKEGHILV